MVGYDGSMASNVNKNRFMFPMATSNNKGEKD